MAYRLATVLCALFAYSQTANADIDFMGGIGFHKGGDTIVSVLYVEGSEPATLETLEAGELLSLDLGVAWDMGFLEGRVTGGWMYDTITGNNGSLTFQRFNATGLLMVALGDWRFGGGTTYHFDVKLEGKGDVAGLSAEFDDAIGAIAEIDYYFNKKAYVGLQYIKIEYDRTTAFGQTAQTFDASSIGLVVVGRW